MDDQGQGDEGPPVPHDGEDEAEPLKRVDESPDGIFVDDSEDVFSESENLESAAPEPPGSSRATPMVIDDDEHDEEAPSERSEGSQSPEGEMASDDDESDYGQDDSLPQVPQDMDIRGGTAACGGIPCQDQCDQYELRIQQRDVLIQTLMDMILGKNARLRTLNTGISQLVLQVHKLGRRPIYGANRLPKKRPRPDPRDDTPERNIDSSRWQHQLRECINGNQSYDTAWRSSQKTLNMSVLPTMCHPQVRFIRKDADEDGSSRQSSPIGLASVRPSEEICAISPLPKLHDNIIFRILEELLTFEGLIHCFHRLDPFHAPTEFPSEQELGGSSTGIKGKFYISKEQRSFLSLTYDTIDPQNLLAALSVSRKFCWYGCHIFYGSNTFAFSSFGEWERFATSTGAARLARLQNLELSWISGQCVRFQSETNKRLNQRTMSLAWMCELPGLKTLVIHIRESGKGVIRRPYEPESRKNYMKRKTSGQPNARMTRSMRATQGMDYIYQLRGLRWVHVYDLTKEIENPDRSGSKIRDQSFVLDLERVTTQEKVPARLEKSRLEKLDRLFPFDEHRWDPRDPEDFDLVRHIFNEDTGYDTRKNDLDFDATSSQGTLDSDDSDGDDSGSDGSPPPALPGRSRRRRPFTPAPGADSGEEELSETDGESHNSGSDDDQDPNDSGGENGGSDVSLETTRQRRVSQYVRRGSTAPG